MRGTLRELAGQRFGKLVTICRAEKTTNSGAVRWVCKCDCGNAHTVIGYVLTQGKTKSCGCLRHVGHSRLRPYEAMYNTLRLKSRGHPVEFTYEEFLNFVGTALCHYCRASLDWSSAHRYNLDRKDSGLGYSVENCVACCTRCNYGKTHRFTYDEWWAMTEIFRRNAC